MSTYSGAPSVTPLLTSVDLIADLINLQRLPGETLKEFKARVLDAYINKAGVSYEGLYNGIARELGEENYSGGIVIDAVRDVDGVPLSTDLSAQLSNRYLRLYDSYPDSTELEIDLLARSGSYFIQDLVSVINTSTNFECITWGTVNNYDKSSYLKRIKSRKRLVNRPLHGEDLHTFYDVLQEGNFISGYPTFSNPLLTTGIRVGEPIATNEFFIGDRYIKTFGFPSSTVSFYWENLPLVIPISTVSIYDFKDDEFMDTITEQIVLNTDTVVDGIPTSLGASYINELLSVYPLGYGQ